MPRIESSNETVRELRGLHLYHAGWSNCSMRVRMTLEEKSLTWTSHHLNTRAGEHITPEFFSINPNGLVPVLVHDGDVWIESADIIRYLDESFPEPPLVPADAGSRNRMTEWMKLASAIHVPAVKTYIYGARPEGKRRKTAAELEQYRRLQSNETLLEFHTRASSAEGLSEQERSTAVALLDDAFSRLDAWLDTRRWIAGDQYSLADITWLPLHYTLQRAGYPLEGFGNVQAWSETMAQRPACDRAVAQWFDGPRDGSGNA